MLVKQQFSYFQSAFEVGTNYSLPAQQEKDSTLLLHYHSSSGTKV
jgi:hypothetical protein